MEGKFNLSTTKWAPKLLTKRKVLLVKCLTVKDGVLYYKWDEGHSAKLLFLTPHTLTREILNLYHDCKMAGHPGITRTLQKVRQTCFWYKMKEDVCLYVEACQEWNTNKKPSRKRRAPLTSFNDGAPVEHLHLDILGPFTPSSSWNKYILMLICQHTKWIEAYPFCRPNRGTRCKGDNR